MTTVATTSAPGQMMANLVLAAAQVNFSNPEELATFARQLATYSAVSTMQVDQRLVAMQTAVDSQHEAVQQRLGRIEQALVQLAATQSANVQAINAQGGRVAQGVAQVQEVLAQVPRAVPVADGLKESTRLMTEHLMRYVMNSAYGHVAAYMMYDEARGPLMVVGGYAVAYAFTRFFGANPPGDLRKFRTQSEVFTALEPLGQVLGGHETRHLFDAAVQLMPYEAVTRECSERAQNRAGQRQRQNKNDKLVAVPIARFVYAARAALEEKPLTSRLSAGTLRHPRSVTYNVANTRYFMDSLVPEKVAETPALKGRGAWNYRMWAEALRARAVREWVQLLRLLNNEAGLDLGGSEPCTCGAMSASSSSSAAPPQCKVSCLHGRALMIRRAQGQCSCGGAGKCGVCLAVTALAWCAHRQVEFAKQKERELGVRAGMLTPAQLGDARYEACKPCHFSGMTLQPEVSVLSHRDTMARVVELRRELEEAEQHKKKKTLPYLALEDEPVLYHIGPLASPAADAASAPRESDEESDSGAPPVPKLRRRAPAASGGAAAAGAARARVRAQAPARRRAPRVETSVRAAEEEAAEEEAAGAAEEDEREGGEESSSSGSEEEMRGAPESSSDEDDDDLPLPLPLIRPPTPANAASMGAARVPPPMHLRRTPPPPPMPEINFDTEHNLRSESSSEEEEEKPAEQEEEEESEDSEEESEEEAAGHEVQATQLVQAPEEQLVQASEEQPVQVQLAVLAEAAAQAAEPGQGEVEEEMDSGVVGEQAPATGEKRKAADEADTQETLFAFKRARQ
jgi:hypothetical protein